MCEYKVSYRFFSYHLHGHTWSYRRKPTVCWAVAEGLVVLLQWCALCLGCSFSADPKFCSRLLFKNHFIRLPWYIHCHFPSTLCLNIRASPVAQMVKHLPATWETQVQSLGQEDPLKKEMATHSSILAWKIPWTEEPGMLQSMGSQRVGHNWVTSLSYFNTERNI